MKKMDKDAFYVKAAGVLAALAVVLAVLLALGGCAPGKRTVKTATASAVVAVRVDTVKEVARDTVWRDRLVERMVERVKREATSVRDSTVRTVDKEGNVIREEHWRGEKTRESSEETERLRDSAAMWKARYEWMLRVKADSVAAAVESATKEERATSRWVPLWTVIGCVLALALGVLAVKMITRWKK